MNQAAHAHILQDVDRIKAAVDQAAGKAGGRVVVVGAGFIGLELAATARQLGKTVTVLEAAPRAGGPTLHLHAPFDAIGSVHAALPAALAVKRAETFDTAGVALVLDLPADRVDDLKTRLRDATRDRVRIDDNG